mmetsp:Transcript_24499/g.81424  ORF Transcript_24499/g.81424 Transcript_24499/m.81424 type:complete len:87 (-) Transcript_24499:541-801(-)
MWEVVESSPVPVALIEIGPHTNAAALLARYPRAASRVQIFAMGGSVVPHIKLPWGHESPVATTNTRRPAPSPATIRPPRDYARDRR